MGEILSFQQQIFVIKFSHRDTMALMCEELCAVEKTSIKIKEEEWKNSSISIFQHKMIIYDVSGERVKIKMGKRKIYCATLSSVRTKHKWYSLKLFSFSMVISRSKNWMEGEIKIEPVERRGKFQHVLHKINDIPYFWLTL